VVQCVAVCLVCCSMLQYVAVCFGTLKHINDHVRRFLIPSAAHLRTSMAQRVGVCCSKLQCVAVCCSVLQCVAVYVPSVDSICRKSVICGVVCWSQLQ